MSAPLGQARSNGLRSDTLIETSRKTAGLIALRESRVNAAGKICILSGTRCVKFCSGTHCVKFCCAHLLQILFLTFLLPAL